MFCHKLSYYQRIHYPSFKLCYKTSFITPERPEALQKKKEIPTLQLKTSRSSRNWSHHHITRNSLRLTESGFTQLNSKLLNPNHIAVPTLYIHIANRFTILQQCVSITISKEEMEKFYFPSGSCFYLFLIDLEARARNITTQITCFR